MRSSGAGVAMALAVAILAACRQPQETQDQPGVPPGAVPAAQDVRPGTEAAPGAVQQPGAMPTPGVGMPTDTVPPGETVTGLDTTPRRNP